jgi:hypothetical protein
MLVFILILGGFAVYIMTPEERVRAARPIRWAAKFLARHGAVAAVMYIRALRARKRWALALPAAVAVIMIVILISQMHLRQFVDIRPEVELLMAAEARMSETYASAVEQFKLGAMSAESLAQHINRKIKPELQVVRMRLMSISRVRGEHAVLLTKAKEYVQLRDESWRLRADALKRRNMAALRKADHAERASLAALNELEQARKPL